MANNKFPCIYTNWLHSARCIIYFLLYCFSQRIVKEGFECPVKQTLSNNESGSNDNDILLLGRKKKERKSQLGLNWMPSLLHMFWSQERRFQYLKFWLYFCCLTVPGYRWVLRLLISVFFFHRTHLLIDICEVIRKYYW